MSRFKIAAVVALLPVPALAQSDAIVVTGIGAPQSRAEAGQAITVVDRALIDQRQAVSLAELLATTPGVTMTRNGGSGQVTALRIRGAEDAQTLVLINGVRVNDPAAPAGAFDFGGLLAGPVDRIEVLRGANSVPWGSAALGGVVNIVTVSPTKDLRAGGVVEYGDRDTLRLNARASGAVGPLRLSGAMGYFNEGGISAYRFGSEPDGYRQFATQGRIEVDITKALTLDLRGIFAKGRVRFDGFPPPLFAFADTDGYSESERIFGYAGLHWQASAGFTNRIAFTYADTSRASYASATTTPSRFRGQTTRFEYHGDLKATAWARFVFGIEHETTRAAEGSTGLTGGFVQAVLKPAAHLTLTGGVRVDSHRAYGTHTTASINAAWHVAPDTTLRASYAEGFKAPTLYQLFSIYGTAGLQPETARSYDFGIEQSLLGGRLRFGATLFARDTVNQIDFTSVPPRADRPFGYYLNVARARARGIETFVELRPTDQLALSANYTLTDAFDRTTGLPLLRRPRHSVNANIDWTAPLGLKLGAGVQTISDSADTDFRTFARTSLDGYTIVAVRAALPVGKHLELFARIENGFDAAYETVSGYGTAGRNAHVGVRVKL